LFFYSALVHDTNIEILSLVFEGLKIISIYHNNDVLKYMFDYGIIFNLLTINYEASKEIQEDSLKIVGNFVLIYEEDTEKSNFYCMVNNNI